VFDEDWKLLGIQITSEATQNEAIRCQGILEVLKETAYTPAVALLIESIEPITTRTGNDEYM
jgi:hypothetical protein